MSNRDDKKWLWLFFKIGGAVVAALVLSWIALVLWNPTETWQTRGQFGDMFGVVNALFSGLAFAAFLVALRQQQQELKDSRDVLSAQLEELKVSNRTNELQAEQLELQKIELEATRKVFEDQSRTLSKQQFEATFFQMLQLFFDYIDEIGPDEDVRSTVFRKYKELVYARLFGVFLETKNVDRSTVLSAYSEHLGDEESILGPYFRLLYNIMKFVDNSDVDNKRFYTNILRASLSMDELVLIFLNGAERGEAKFKPLIEKYTLLKHLDKDMQFEELFGTHVDIFAKTAFVKPRT
ncbi:MAG: hypothetical protein KDB65_07625 [Calditrichaeota bacterium]|nr:hypothetical protein [Calditrichota bacterium]MCB9369339.1 hypothetical protein [Calditrichota bacterium]